MGDKGAAVTELQKRLIELGYLATSATGTFGEATKAAVTEFQKMAGLTADGVAGTATVNALFATDAPARVDTTTLKQGDKGDSVKALQKRLIELGYLTGTADGTFGAATKAAVKEFQTAAGISADGVAGAATITALFSASAPRKPDGTLTAAPSTSPEHGPVDEGTTFTHAVVREILLDCIEAAKVLKTDADEVKKWQKILDELAPYRIGRYGQLME